VLPLGHLAAGVVASDLIDGDPLAAAFTSQVPDLVDKPLAWILKTTSSSRFVAHTFVALACWVAIARIWRGPRVMRGTLAGYVTHLAGDQMLGGKVPLLWPVKRYKLGHNSFRLRLRPLVIELAAAAYLYRRWSRV
jgi:membrane-bound metal-dependent hydrolase YbcI (DUF457 family)